MRSHSTKTPRRLWGRHDLGDTGQAALVVVVAFTVMLTVFGGVMVNAIVNNAPILKQASIQRYAYRALASGLNAYQNAINANPYLAACNSSTNYLPGPPASGNPQCAGLNYQTWSEVPGTDVGNGVIPEYYKFDNPQQIKDSTTQAITYLEVQVVGSAGFPGKNVSYSTVAKFTPQNGFLNGVWWSNFESSQFPTGSASNCGYFYNQGRQINNDGTVGNTPCQNVVFVSGDKLYGPVYSNDSMYISGNPTFSGTVNTADPHCLFVNDGNNQDDTPACTTLASSISYTHAGSGFNNPNEPLPQDNSQLAATAKQGGCYYEGPTTVTLSVNGSGVGQVSVVSKQTTTSGGVDQMNLAIDTSTCRTDGTATALPVNGVIYVNDSSCTASGATACNVSANPFTPNTGGTSQVQSNCSNCYYGATGSPYKEGDAFVYGSLSGHLTVAASNDVIIDGPITYKDCTWVGTASQTICNYNDAVASNAPPNDTLGLIANKYVEVNRPIYNSSASFSNRGKPLPDCGSIGALAAPLCDPATSTGSANAQGLTIDATILALNESFVVNNYDTAGDEGQLTVYGSIQQNARGPVGTFGGQGNTGYLKYYLWDPRLTLYGPPYYLTPGTPSWALTSSAESYTGTCPVMPPAQAKPTGTVPVWPISGSTTCVPAS